MRFAAALCVHRVCVCVFVGVHEVLFNLRRLYLKCQPSTLKTSFTQIIYSVIYFHIKDSFVLLLLPILVLGQCGW